MPKHLFFNTIYLQPLTIMDIIQAYTMWAKNHKTDRKHREIAIDADDPTIKDIIEEFYVDNKYILTSHINLNPTNPSIVLLETYSENEYNDDVSKVDVIKEDSDDYLEYDKCIKLNAGKKIAMDVSVNRDNGPEQIVSSDPDSGISTAAAAHFQQIFYDEDLKEEWNSWMYLTRHWQIYVRPNGTAFDVWLWDAEAKTKTYFRAVNTLESTRSMLEYFASNSTGFGDFVESLV